MSHNNFFNFNLEDVLIQMTSRFMDFVETPFVGYRIKPQYAKIISNPNPENV